MIIQILTIAAGGLLSVTGTLMVNSAQKSPGRPLSPADLAERFNGCAVRPDDFEAKDNALYRVNSDGDRIALTGWYFDRQTGEFFKIKRHENGRPVFSTRSYRVRWQEYNQKAPQRYLGLACIPVLILLALWMVGIATTAGQTVGPFEQGGMMVALLGACGLFFWATWPKAWLVGPEPIEPVVGGFGDGPIPGMPGAAMSRSGHPGNTADDDDETRFRPAR